MKICVDLVKCQLHGQCAIAAPALFGFDGQGRLQWVTEIDEGRRPDAEAAADACPEQAITIED